MSPSPDTPEPPEPDRLNGWKDIAGYLDKSVRTVQRWEGELGLPVQRLRHNSGETIWASKRELDAWLQGRSDVAHRSAETDTNQEPPPQPQAVPVPGPRRLTPVLVAGGLLTLLLIGFSAWSRPSLAAPQPARAALSDGSLHIFDHAGRLLFSKSIPFMKKDDFGGPINGKPDRWVDFVDLESDGSVEVLFKAMSQEFHPDTALIAFNADGTERFRIRPQNRVVFGDKEYSGPWRPHGVYVGDRPGGERVLFLVFIGPLEFPSLLLEVDRAGRIESEYWSNGYIESVAFRHWNEGPALFVGASYNEAKSSSLAVFRSGHPSGSAPASLAKYRCGSCATGGPDEFLVFPRRSMARTLDRGAAVQELRIEQNGSVHVSTGEAMRGPDGRLYYEAWYQFDRGLNLTGALLPDGFNAGYEMHLRAGRLTQPLGPHVETELFPVRRWDGAAFVDLPPAPVAR